MSGENPEPNLRPVVKVTFDAAPTYVPTQTVTAVDGATISSEQFFGRASALRYSGAQAYDAYLVNKTDKAITDLTLKFSGNFDASTTYKITLGTTSVDVTGAQIEAGEVGEGLTLEPGKVPPAPGAGTPLLLRQPDRPALRECDPARLRRKRGHPASRHRHGPRVGLREGGGERHLHRRRIGPPGRHYPVVPRPQGIDRRSGDSGRNELHVYPDDDARG